MRKRNHIREGAGLFLFAAAVVCLCGLPAYAQEARGDTTAYWDSADEASEITDLSDEFSVILNESPNTFYAGYPIDESFLLWLDAGYGDEVVKRLAGYVGQSETDPELWYRETGSSIHVLWLEYCKDLRYSTYQLANVEWRDAASEDVIVMDFVGDVNFAEDWYTMEALAGRENGIDDCIAAEVQAELTSADITLVNNEFTYSAGGAPLEGKAYTFRADPASVELLSAFGTDIVSLANNHVWDYGEEALLDTFDVLDGAGIPYIGAGHDLAEAEQIYYYIINGRKIAFVSATQIEKTYNYTKEATEDSPGVLKTLDPEKFLAVIREARRKSDYVIAYVHWGTEGMLYPDEDQRVLAQQYADAGADVIIGNHSHRLQGVSYIDGVPVIYSLGNFWFSTGTIYTTILQVRIADDGGLSVAMLPCQQQDMTTVLLTEQSQIDGFYQYIADLSVNVGIDADGVLHEGAFTGEFAYTSGVYYGSHSGAYDLEGRRINIVGNF